jgi:predicted transcriptional regulator
MATVNRGRYTTTIDLELIKQIKELSDKTRIAQSKLMDEAIKDLLEKFKGSN